MNGTWNLTSATNGISTVVNATEIPLNGGNLNVTRGSAAVQRGHRFRHRQLRQQHLDQNGAGILQLTGSSNYSGDDSPAEYCRQAIPRPWG